MVFFVRITVNQSHLRPICKSTKFNPKIQRTIYLINFQQLRLHVPDFIRTVVNIYIRFKIYPSPFTTTHIHHRIPNICFPGLFFGDILLSFGDIFVFFGDILLSFGVIFGLMSSEIVIV